MTRFEQEPVGCDPAGQFVYERHLESRTIVIRELKLLYVAVPKAAWTSLLTLLADLAGLPRSAFTGSLKPEVTMPMAVHDMAIWRRAGRVLETLEAHERDQALTGNDWFRFTVVRDPASRLWSAWQSKLLMREPAYADTFGDQPWFPRIPTNPDQIVEDFRAFTLALRERAWDDSVRDVHWAPQHLLAHRLPLGHVGRVERLEDTLNALRAHLSGGAVVPTALPQENRALLAFTPGLYDEKSADTVADLYADDYTHFGYTPTRVEGEADRALERWEQRTAELLPALCEMIARHERLGALHAAMDRRHQAGSQRRDRQRERIEALEHRARTHRERAAHQRERIVHLRGQVEKVTGERNTLRREVRRMLESRSWRLTRPVRALSRMLRRG
ncbi:MAG: sulfotransferase family 2 domain-containing protein [Actinomycetes bacterium]